MDSGRTHVAVEPAVLREQLENLRSMLKDFDLDGAEEWSEKAAGYTVSDDTDEKLRAIRTDIQMIDYLGAIKHVDELLESL